MFLTFCFFILMGMSTQNVKWSRIYIKAQLREENSKRPNNKYEMDYPTFLSMLLHSSKPWFPCFYNEEPVLHVDFGPHHQILDSLALGPYLIHFWNLLYVWLARDGTHWPT